MYRIYCLSLRLYDRLLEIPPLLLVLAVAVPNTLHVLHRVSLAIEKHSTSNTNLQLGKEGIADTRHQHHGDQEWYHRLGSHDGVVALSNGRTARWVWFFAIA